MNIQHRDDDIDSDEDLIRNAKRYVEKELLEGFSYLKIRMDKSKKRKFKFIDQLCILLIFN